MIVVFWFASIYLLDIHKTPVSWQCIDTSPKDELERSDIWEQGQMDDWQRCSGPCCQWNTKKKKEQNGYSLAAWFYQPIRLFREPFLQSLHFRLFWKLGKCEYT